MVNHLITIVIYKYALNRTSVFFRCAGRSDCCSSSRELLSLWSPCLECVRSTGCHSRSQRSSPIHLQNDNKNPNDYSSQSYTIMYCAKADRFASVITKRTRWYTCFLSKTSINYIAYNYGQMNGKLKNFKILGYLPPPLLPPTLRTNKPLRIHTGHVTCTYIHC